MNAKRASIGLLGLVRSLAQGNRIDRDILHDTPHHRGGGGDMTFPSLGILLAGLAVLGGAPPAAATSCTGPPAALSTRISKTGPLGNVVVTWDAQPETTYDVIRGTMSDLADGGLFRGAACASNDIPGPPTPGTASYSEPLLNDCTAGGCWYLVRAQNACGTGPWGSFPLDTANFGGTCAPACACDDLDSNTSDYCDPNNVPQHTPITSLPSVGAGFYNTCGVRTNGTIACCGNNAYGQSTPLAGTFASVSAGESHTCAVRTNGTVACWGDNSAPASPPAGTFVSITAGAHHNCGILTDGTVACWGYNFYGEATAPAGTFTSLGAGNLTTCGVRTDHTVACWGADTPETRPPAGTFLSLSAGDSHTCGVRTDDTVACWGHNNYGEILPPAGTFASVSAGGFHTCGVRTDRTVACWGYNFYGQSTPPAGTFASVSAGFHHSCGVRMNGTVACWGFNVYGQASPSGFP
jgi:hypothetical protein